MLWHQMVSGVVFEPFFYNLATQFKNISSSQLNESTCHERSVISSIFSLSWIILRIPFHVVVWIKKK